MRTDCKECGAQELKIGITNTVSGSTIYYPLYCEKCGCVATQYVKKQIAMEYACKNGPLKYVQTKTAKFIEPLSAHSPS